MSPTSSSPFWLPVRIRNGDSALVDYERDEHPAGLFARLLMITNTVSIAATGSTLLSVASTTPLARNVREFRWTSESLLSRLGTTAWVQRWASQRRIFAFHS